MFTRDLDLDPLLLKVSHKINERKLERQKIGQSSIGDFFKKQLELLVSLKLFQTEQDLLKRIFMVQNFYEKSILGTE